MTAKKTTATRTARTTASRPSTTRAAKATTAARAPRARSKAAAKAAAASEAIATDAPGIADLAIPGMIEAIASIAASPADEATSARHVTDDDIRVRAYFLALEQRGRGGSLDFWLQAERELRRGADGD